ncbi:PIN domain-containing protein [Nostocoides sp. F2B08]|uniref:type II toxin-antitoxin system VapC family toxin n=1 Tax=Nostocoides sp. F2B08 TaxID=2653936 RepID=UPI0012634EAF|nr:type II toxin-antitoxin system VapC family toxin [Tetrasphaera sp. F2B08]KAB7743458.1 PIN domain-containing protein [Tetrasphaera sp. F2B08]
MIIADTNVVSEFMRDDPDPEVMAWARTVAPADLCICVVTVEEIERGLALLPAGRRRRDLTARWRDLVDIFADAVVVYDLPAAQQTAAILGAAQAAGRPISLADAQIAGICRGSDHDLATRNVDDFSTVSGLTLINPFQQ